MRVYPHICPHISLFLPKSEGIYAGVPSHLPAHLPAHFSLGDLSLSQFRHTGRQLRTI